MVVDFHALNRSFLYFFSVEADPIDLAKHLTARPSNVSIVSIESEALTISAPEVGEFEPFNFNIPPLKVSILRSGVSRANFIYIFRQLFVNCES